MSAIPRAALAMGLALLPCAQRREWKIEYVPRPCAAVTLRHVARTELDLELAYIGPGLHFVPVGGIRAMCEIHVRDEWARVACDRPPDFLRHFERIEGAVEAEIPLSRAEALLSSPFQGEAVDVRWRECGYGVEWDPCTGRRTELPEEWLSAVSTDGFFQSLAPRVPVAVEDSWDLGKSAVLGLLRPAGRIAWKVEQPDELQGHARSELPHLAWLCLLHQAGELTLAEGTAELVGVNRNIATIELELSIEAVRTVAGDLADVLRFEESTSGVERTVVQRFRGSGVLRWDVDQGLPLSVEIAGKTDVDVRTQREGDAESMGRLELRGETRIAAEVSLAR